MRRSVVICAYTVDRWTVLQRAVESATTDSVDDEVVLVIDHSDDLLARSLDRWPDHVVIPNRHEHGLSGARNTGIAASSGEIIVFLDDDAVARPGWLDALVAPFEDPRVGLTGGLVQPHWLDGPTPWFPDEFLWVVGCSHLGLPTETAPIRNPIGASMAIRRTVLDGLGGFRTGVGRVDTVPLGCEETELAIRARQRGFDVVFEPRAVVDHQVTGIRGTFGYFVRRCYAEGLSKAKITDVVSVGEALETERRYVVRTLPRGVVRGVVRFVTGPHRWDALRSSAAIVIGLGTTSVGFVIGRLRRTRAPGRARDEVAPTGTPVGTVAR